MSTPTAPRNTPQTPPAPPEATPVVGQPLPHESATLHVTGRAAYCDDLPEPVGTLHAALGLSPVAHGRLHGLDRERLLAQPGVVAVFTAADLPGENNVGPILHDDPILADGTLRYLGQPVFAVVAHSREAARRAAALASQVLHIEPLPAQLDLRAAHAAQDWVVPPMHLTRATHPGGVDQALAEAPHQLTGHFSLGGQEQFYLEGQISFALPQDDGGLLLHCSTQHPSEMQALVGHALGLPLHAVQVSCRRMGGGFGGKESQSALFACVAALAAQRLNRPVKLRPDRDDDFLITGRRHGFEFDWTAGFDDQGRLLALEITLLGQAGHSADLSPPVMTRALCHVDNAYWLPNVALHGYLPRTHTQSNTAFRGFGGPQGALVTEVILDTVARHLGLDPLAVRQANYYGVGERHLTPYGQPVVDNVLEPLTNELLTSSAYARRRAEIAAFNVGSPWVKRGLAFSPVKFGISFNVNHYNQAGALVHCYLDGSVLVNHGGTEMGQGLNTKVAQVVAHTLGLRLDQVRCSATDTSKVANTSATAASTGADLNGKAAQVAALALRERLCAVAAQGWGVPASEVQLHSGHAWAPDGRHLAWALLVQQAYLARVQLWADGFYATPGLHWDRQTLTGRPFYYFAYGAAVSEVELDTLTGEWTLRRADLLHDVGASLNPALDIGQVEGAFVQGMGWLTSEELVWHPVSGKLLTHAPSTYKIPTAGDVPDALHTRLFQNRNAEDTVHRSKAVGEPPLLLGFSVFLALRDAVAAAGPAGCQPPLRAPATPESLLNALDAVRSPAPPAAPGV
ncbi:xanthine dehydrogenase molybdopterin binding subunit [Ideonella livida]|uniref:Xanthine dehydrogenase molybdopterin binding subunit n=1 Tax=Ideonella livida TaxID=2707176 RepID=A0A7C9PEQ2_9BURK|nr:xanthine dehydrogenase molybdopterin binding subunit [Ideonella livida]NDY90033.1 xanthine dehydrogenase molybdopterin binding subunit [Ideonella livida]